MNQLPDLLSYIINTKNGQLQHLTGEKDRRRIELRDIASKIAKANQTEIIPLIAEVKVRINAYGIERKFDDDFFKDTHIWACLEKLENCQSDDLAFNKYKNQLISFLSILLKQDWDFAKSSAAGNSKDMPNHLYYITYLILFVLYYVYIWKMSLTMSAVSQFAGITSLYFAFFEFLLIRFEKGVNNKVKKGYGIVHNFFCMELRLCIARRMSIFIEIIIFLYPLLIWKDTPPEVYISLVSGKLMPMGLIYLLIYALIYCDAWLKFRRKKNYILSILAVAHKEQLTM